MNATELRELAKREYEEAVAKARLVYDTRLDIAKRMERGARQPVAVRKTQKFEITGVAPALPAEPGVHAQGADLDVDAVPSLEIAVREILKSRTGEVFKIGDLRDWLIVAYPGIRTDRQGIHRVLKKLRRDLIVKVLDENVRGNEGFSFEVLGADKV